MIDRDKNIRGILSNGLCDSIYDWLFSEYCYITWFFSFGNSFNVLNRIRCEIVAKKETNYRKA